MSQDMAVALSRALATVAPVAAVGAEVGASNPDALALLAATARAAALLRGALAATQAAVLEPDSAGQYRQYRGAELGSSRPPVTVRGVSQQAELVTAVGHTLATRGYSAELDASLAVRMQQHRELQQVLYHTRLITEQPAKGDAQASSRNQQQHGGAAQRDSPTATAVTAVTAGLVLPHLMSASHALMSSQRPAVQLSAQDMSRVLWSASQLGAVPDQAWCDAAAARLAAAVTVPRRGAVAEFNSWASVSLPSSLRLLTGLLQSSDSARVPPSMLRLLHAMEQRLTAQPDGGSQGPPAVRSQDVLTAVQVVVGVSHALVTGSRPPSQKQPAVTVQAVSQPEVAHALKRLAVTALGNLVGREHCGEVLLSILAELRRAGHANILIH